MSVPPPLVFLVTNRVSLEEVGLSSFEVLDCWLNLADSCLDGENEIQLNVIASFSAVRFALPLIPLIVLHSFVRSVFLVHGLNKLSVFSVFVSRCVSGCLYSVLSVQVR